MTKRARSVEKSTSHNFKGEIWSDRPDYEATLRDVSLHHTNGVCCTYYSVFEVNRISTMYYI